jgi:hypothetical protein
MPTLASIGNGPARAVSFSVLPKGGWPLLSTLDLRLIAGLALALFSCSVPISRVIFLVTSMRQAAVEPPADLAPPGTQIEPTHGSNGQFSLWSFDGISVKQHWVWTPQEHPVEYAEVMIADLMGNGHLRGIVSSWCHVWNIDLATGELVSHTTWDPNGANQRHLRPGDVDLLSKATVVENGDFSLGDQRKVRRCVGPKRASFARKPRYS